MVVLFSIIILTSRRQNYEKRFNPDSYWPFSSSLTIHIFGMDIQLLPQKDSIYQFHQDEIQLEEILFQADSQFRKMITDLYYNKKENVSQEGISLFSIEFLRNCLANNAQQTSLSTTPLLSGCAPFEADFVYAIETENNDLLSYLAGLNPKYKDGNQPFFFRNEINIDKLVNLSIEKKNCDIIRTLFSYAVQKSNKDYLFEAIRLGNYDVATCVYNEHTRKFYKSISENVSQKIFHAILTKDFHVRNIMVRNDATERNLLFYAIVGGLGEKHHVYTQKGSIKLVKFLLELLPASQKQECIDYWLKSKSIDYKDRPYWHFLVLQENRKMIQWLVKNNIFLANAQQADVNNLNAHIDQFAPGNIFAKGEFRNFITALIKKYKPELFQLLFSSNLISSSDSSEEES